jgi:hypothetical protein
MPADVLFGDVVLAGGDGLERRENTLLLRAVGTVVRHCFKRLQKHVRAQFLK